MTSSNRKSVCVFCGSRVGRRGEYAAAARSLGTLLAELGVRLVYGGGNVGIMGVIADAVLERGGEVIGVIPEALVGRELAHAGVSDMRIVPSMHARKALMADLSDGFLALPGGLGTLEELCEVLTWSQLRFHEKPALLWNVEGYFSPLIAMLDRAVEEEFMTPRSRELLQLAEGLEEVQQWIATMGV